MTGLGLAGAVALAALPFGAVAQGVGDLMAAMRVPELMEIMSEEGLSYAGDLEDELFAGRGGPAWQAAVAGIYDPVAMTETFAGAFAAALDPDQAPPLVAFFTSERGARIIELEIGARRAFLDPDLEEAAIEAFAAMKDTAGAEPLEAFVAANDLVESNVMGALNSNYAFFRGLNEGGGFPRSMSQGELLADVWSQEEAIRADTEEWVYAYLSLAYRPLPEGDLEIYTEFSASEAGQALNAALFSAFDTLFTGISYNLGTAAARFIVGEDI